jgi:ribonuclease T2
MDQHSYFAAALRLKARFNLTRILLDAGVAPSDERTYSVSSIREAIGKETGWEPSIECNRNARNETQLYQVYQCVDLAGTSLVPCPVKMPGRCTDLVMFPVF